MPYHLDIELTETQKREMAEIPAESWFTPVDFDNARSPRHPASKGQLEANNEMKQKLVLPWIR